MSLIHVSATFLLLSNAKIVNLSFSLISVPNTLYNRYGTAIPTKYTFYNGSMEYLGHDYLPYFVLGLIVIAIFNVLPLLACILAAGFRKL